jgi:small-conductance mechanosensitive channel
VQGGREAAFLLELKRTGIGGSSMTLDGRLLYDILFSAAVVAAAAAVGLILHALLAFLLKRRERREGGTEKRQGLALKRLKAPLRALIPGICVSAVLPFLRLPEGIQAGFGHALGLWIIGSIAWLVSGAVLAARDVGLSRYDFTARDDLQARRVATQLRVIGRVLVTVIVIVAASIGLMTFSRIRQMGVSLLASAGVLSLIVGLAAQKTLGNLIAGIQIAFAQPVRLGDVVVVEKEFGSVEEITLTYVIVRLWNLRRLVLPISYFVEHPFENWTRRSSAILGAVSIYADYAVPVEEVRRELGRIVERSPRWDRRMLTLEVTGATDRAVELRAVVSAEDSAASWSLRCEVREKLLAFLQEKYPESLPRVRVGLDGGRPAGPGVPEAGTGR